MIIAVVNQKGGVGKTTLAVHLAVWLHEQGRRVAFIDADGQSSSTRWVRTAEPGVSLHTETGADAIIEKANDLRSRFDVVVADGPANLSESTRALLLVADHALVPCGSTVPELESTADTLRILRNAHRIRPPGLPHACVVLSRLRNDRYLLTREAIDAARMLGGEAILAAQTALYEELVLFFQGLGRSDLAKAVDTQRRMIDLAVSRIETRIEKLDLEAAIETTLGDSSTSWPASAASTPAP